VPKVEAWWSTVSEHSNDQFTSDGAIIAPVTEVVDTAARHIRGPLRFYRRRCVRSPPRSGHDPSFTAVLRSEKGRTL
jgi:hypothetical protein